MPVNLTPQYRAAEASFRAAHTQEEKRTALEEMLVLIPKQKGTEKMQVDIKRRLARLRQEAERRTAKRGHAVHVEPEGAAQVALLGAPNAGKSSLLKALTHAEPAVAEYPFTTTRPQPGMMLFEDVQLQLVDLPPVTATHLDPWLPNVLKLADAALLLADPTNPDVLSGVEELLERLSAEHVPLVGALPEQSDPHELPLPTLLVISKVDLASEDDVAVLEELYGERFPTVRFSATTRAGLQPLKAALWRLLQLVRVHVKTHGQKLERSEPLVLPNGATVIDLAGRVDPDLPEKLAYARIWGGKLEGQRVARDFELRDRDLVELAR